MKKYFINGELSESDNDVVQRVVSKLHDLAKSADTKNIDGVEAVAMTKGSDTYYIPINDDQVFKEIVDSMKEQLKSVDYSNIDENQIYEALIAH